MINEENVARQLKIAAWIAGLTFLCWCAVIGLSAWGYNFSKIEWNYERTGQLGDSFGVISAIMTSAAAYFTFRTMTIERAESKRLRARDENSDRINRIASEEVTFFRLLEARRSVVQSLQFPTTSNAKGQSAFTLLVDNLGDINNKNDAKLAFTHCYAENESGLAHYFRLTYHVVRYADDSSTDCNGKYSLVRLLRAEISSSELILLSMNCAFGRGRRAFKPLAERYALFHNLAIAQRVLYHVKSSLRPSAFSSEKAKAAFALRLPTDVT